VTAGGGGIILVKAQSEELSEKMTFGQTGK